MVDLQYVFVRKGGPEALFKAKLSQYPGRNLNYSVLTSFVTLMEHKFNFKHVPRSVMREIHDTRRPNLSPAR